MAFLNSAILPTLMQKSVEASLRLLVESDFTLCGHVDGSVLNSLGTFRPAVTRIKK